MNDLETDFDLTEEQEMIRETVERFPDEVVACGAAYADETCTSIQDVWSQMCKLGLPALPFPEEEGGAKDRKIKPV